MRDPLSWSIPMGRLFGINIRVHILFPIVAIGLILRAAHQKTPPPVDGAWIDAALIMGLLFLSVLLHEFGHCFMARAVGGDASDVLMWPLGGLAYVDVPHNPRANFLTAAAGPAVNLGLAVACALALYFIGSPGYQPPWDPFYYPGRTSIDQFPMTTWGGHAMAVGPYSAAALLSRFFWVNWFGFLFNIILVGFPMDSGRMVQSIVWHFTSYRQGTLAAVFLGFVCMFVVGLWSIVTNEMLGFALALFIYVSCKHQWMVLETGGDESVFGYDFSQGYTSLERDAPEPAPQPRRQSWWQRWLQKRAARRIQRAIEDREADERRMDQLLEKISTQGIGSLTDEEKRFMKQFSDRYKNRHQ